MKWRPALTGANMNRNSNGVCNSIEFNSNGILFYSNFCRDGEPDRSYREHSEQKSNSDGENFINPASFL